MAFPRALAAAQRQSLHSDTLEALDSAEALHRQIQKVDAPHLIAVTAEELAELAHHFDVAYKALAKARQITDPEGGTR